MKKPKKHKRLRVFADFKTQTALCLRVIVYWFVCQLSIIGPMCFLAGLDGPDGAPASITRFIVPAVILSSCLLPVALLDLLIFSNRFAGPLMNFRGKFSRFVNKGVVEEIHFRSNDYYKDLEENFNKLCRDVSPPKSGEPATEELSHGKLDQTLTEV